MSSDEAVLRLTGVSKRFGGLVALDDVDISVGRDELVGLIGPNGAGKSTLLNVVTGVHPVTEGRIEFLGSDITSDPMASIASRGIMRTFQESTHFEHSTGLENLRIANIENRVFSRNAFFSVLSTATVDRSALARVSALVDLGDGQLEKEPGNMTHLELTKLAIGRALMNEPTIIMLDEPFAGLTSGEAEEISVVVQKIHESGVTTLVIDHNVGKVTDIADRVIVLDQGQVIAVGGADEILEDERVRSAYFGE